MMELSPSVVITERARSILVTHTEKSGKQNGQER